ncbi:type I methionyl aminopeptidase [candidate division WWE3 bacterium]|nr:type I methionyl aminopeptidase [candidate division WWE3 bacterium]
MIVLKTNEEIEKIAKAGRIAKVALDLALTEVKPGVTTMHIEEIVSRCITSKGAFPGFKTVDNYKYATCININDGLVHGLPSSYVLKVGDLVSVDLGAMLDGWQSDLSYTVEVETHKYEKFLNTGLNALNAGIKNARSECKMGDIGYAMQKLVENEGFSVSRDLVGHGIGRNLHEDPMVPGYGRPGKGINLKNGMVLAIELIYQMGDFAIETARDNWTIVTKDGSMGAIFEHTVAITPEGPRILTL